MRLGSSSATSGHSASAAELPKAVVPSKNQSVKLKSTDLRAQLASALRQCRAQWIVVRCDSGARSPYNYMAQRMAVHKPYVLPHGPEDIQGNGLSVSRAVLH